MIVRQSLLRQLLIILLIDIAASISLSQFQQIQGFSTSCESVWQEDIPGCTKHDFTGSGSCSRTCLAGVNIIDAEVLVACADAQVGSNTLLGEFLNGNGVSALCTDSGSQTTSVSLASETTATDTGAESMTATTTATAATTTSSVVTSTESSSRTTTTAAESTTTRSTEPPKTSTTSSQISTSSSSSSSSSPNSDLTITFSGSTSTASQMTSSSTSSSASSSSSSDPEAKGFGGVGDSNDILGGESSGSQLKCSTFGVMIIMSFIAISIARGIW